MSKDLLSHARIHPERDTTYHITIELDFCQKIAEEMEREKDSGARQDRSLPEPPPATSDLPTMRYGRTLKEMLASGKESKIM